MLTIKNNQWFDLNLIGIGLAISLTILMLFYHIPIIYRLMIDFFLIVTIYLLYKNTKLKQSIVIIINSENKWFIEQNGNMLPVEVNDYWLQTKRIFIWLKSSKVSLSVVISRQIIGAEKFSQLRAKII
jgi:hypothetical protein